MEIQDRGFRLKASSRFLIETSKKGKTIMKRMNIPVCKPAWAAGLLALTSIVALAVDIDPLTTRWTFGAHEPYTMYRRVGRHCTGGIDGNAQWGRQCAVGAGMAGLVRRKGSGGDGGAGAQLPAFPLLQGHGLGSREEGLPERAEVREELSRPRRQGARLRAVQHPVPRGHAA